MDGKKIFSVFFCCLLCSCKSTNTISYGFEYSDISSGIKLGLKGNERQLTNNISLSIFLGHYSSFDSYWNYYTQNEDIKNCVFVLVREIMNMDDSICYSNDIICEIDDFLSDGYCFNESNSTIIYSKPIINEFSYNLDIKKGLLKYSIEAVDSLDYTKKYSINCGIDNAWFKFMINDNYINFSTLS